MTTPSIDLYDGMMTTRAMRRFTDEPVADEVVTSILAAAVQAPSGGNIQPYHFVVVTDPAKRAALGELYLRGWQRYEPVVRASAPPPRSEGAAQAIERNVAATDHLARNFGRAPVVIMVLALRRSMELRDEQGAMDVGSVYASVYPAVQNLILAARARGLGTVLTTLHRIYDAETRAVCEIPDHFEIAAVLPLGHPTGRWGVAARRPAPSITSWDTFGTRR